MNDVEKILEEREEKYGDFSEHAEISQNLKKYIREMLADRRKSLCDYQQEALDMICLKIGRIVNGDPHHADSWVDIAGYAKLVADRLEGVER